MEMLFKSLFFKSVFQENEAKDLRASFTVQYNS